jgi:hypothetical protein
MGGRTICCAVDESERSKEALQLALDHIVKPRDELHLLTVIEPEAGPNVLNTGDSSFIVDSDVSTVSTCKTLSLSLSLDLRHHALQGECQPDPVRLERSQQMLLEQKQLAHAHGVPNVHCTVVASCVGGSTDIGRQVQKSSLSLCIPFTPPAIDTEPSGSTCTH